MNNYFRHVITAHSHGGMKAAVNVVMQHNPEMTRSAAHDLAFDIIFEFVS